MFTYNSFNHQLFVYTQLNYQTVQLQTIHFNINRLFALSLPEYKQITYVKLNC